MMTQSLMLAKKPHVVIGEYLFWILAFCILNRCSRTHAHYTLSEFVSFGMKVTSLGLSTQWNIQLVLFVVMCQCHCTNTVLMYNKAMFLGVYFTATPGRLVDHLENTKGFNLRALKYLVCRQVFCLVNNIMCEN